MHLHLVDALEQTLVIRVEDVIEASALFTGSVALYPWIAGTILDSDRYVESFIRIDADPDNHPLIDQSMIDTCVGVRRDCRTDEQPYSEAKWAIPGFCHEVSEFIQHEYGFARASGTFMAKDLVTPIGLHYWNILPDLSILDMTADQFMEGSDYRIIPKEHPDWLRYQPEYEYVDDIESIRGKGVYSDKLIDFIKETSNRLGSKTSSSLIEYLHAQPAKAETSDRIRPIVTEYLNSAIRQNAHDQAVIKKPDRRTGNDGPSF
jgi:predicted HicB family RNase H-like nuclease